MNYSYKKFLFIVISAFLYHHSSKASEDCPFTNCIKCSDDKKRCSQCASNYIFSREENICFFTGPCPLGEYKAANSGECLPCEGSCRTCWGASEYNCYTCLDGFFWMYYRGAGKCLTCPETFCRKCEQGSGKCLLCTDGYRLNKDTDKCN